MLNFFNSVYAKGIFSSVSGQIPKIKFSISNKKITALMSDYTDTIRGKIVYNTPNILPESSFIIQDLSNMISFLKSVKSPFIDIEFNKKYNLPIYIKIQDNIEKSVGKFVLAKESIVKDIKFPEKIEPYFSIKLSPINVKNIIKKGSTIKSEFIFVVFEGKTLNFIFSKDYTKLNNSIKVEVALLENALPQENLTVKFSSKEFISLISLFEQDFNFSFFSPNNILYLYNFNDSISQEFLMAPKKL